MPRLSDSMEEGTILKWLVSDGDEVKRGQEIAEIETDKATMTYEADADGVLHITAKEGETLPIGEKIATIGEEAPSGGNGASAPSKAEEEPAEDEDQPAGEEESAQDEQPAGDEQKQAERPAARKQEAAAQSDGDGAGPDGRVKASPIARRLAKEQGVDLGGLQGSGPGGRIVKADVEKAAAGGGDAGKAEPEQREDAQPAKAQASKAPPRTDAQVAERGTAKGDVLVEDLSRTQQVVARRMAEAKATVPEFTLQTEIDMERCVELRAELKELAGEDGVVPSYNDMIVKACALALRDFPRANGAYKDGKFELYGRVNVGVAVAAQDSLVVATVFDADGKGLGQIARDTRKAAARVRDGTITPPELSGGTFTVSNLGMFGVTNFTAVINSPQAAILAVGAMEPRPVVRKGKVKVRNVMGVTLACDHRILYGADAAQFLARIRELLEEPLRLAL
jgi:pyruvate dehydrogenase E2 component (dihydrolipoamide acetyltransferase)